MEEYKETSDKKQIAIVGIFLVLTTAAAMGSGILFYDMLLSDVVPIVCIGVMLSLVYLFFVVPWISKRFFVILGCHILELVIVVAGFLLPAVYRPVCAIPVILVLLMDLQAGMGAMAYYGILAVLYGLDPVESLMLYFIYGMAACLLARWMKSIRSFAVCQVILIIWSSAMYVLLQWFTYMELQVVFIREGIIGAGITALILLCFYPFLHKKKDKKAVQEQRPQKTDKNIEKTKHKTKEKIKPVRILESKYEKYTQDSHPAIEELKERDMTIYKHSKVVAEISRQAAVNVGCDATLAKAGGFYHEIGQGLGSDYVEESLAIIKKYRIPKQIAAIVREHNAEAAVPTSKEAAIVMLSDTIISTMEHNRKKSSTAFDTKQLIEKVFEIRIQTGKLEKSLLSADDIEILKATYQKLLG